MKLRTLVISLCALVFPTVSMAQTSDTSDLADSIKIALDPKKREELCVNARTDLPAKTLLGRVAQAYSLDIFDLSDKRAHINVSESEPFEKAVAAWFVSSVSQRAVLAKENQERLGNAIIELGAFVEDSIEGNLSESVGYKVEFAGGIVRLPRLEKDKMALLFRGILSDRATPPGLTVKCLPITDEPPQAGNVNEESNSDKKPKIVWSVRKEIDDLSVRASDKSAFKKLKSANVAFTDNKVKGEESLSVDIVVGAGRFLSTRDYLHFFVAYENESTETGIPDDDDDTNDVNSLKPGLLIARSLSAEGESNAFVGSFGLVTYPVFDFAQNSKSLKARAFINDISFNLGRFSAICGSDFPVNAYLILDCRLNAFAELGHVFEAGSNMDFQTIEDDQYAGLGGQASLIVQFGNSKFLKPFTMSASYKYMEILSGTLSNPEKFIASLNYKVGASNFELGLSYEDGQNFDSFVDEETFKFTAGWKY